MNFNPESIYEELAECASLRLLMESGKVCEETGDTGIGGEETVAVVDFAMVIVLTNNNIVPTLDCIELFEAVSLFVCGNYFNPNIIN